MQKFFSEAIEEIKKKGLHRKTQTYEPVSASHVLIEGKTYLMLAANNYLGLTHHKAVKKAAIDAVLAYGTGSGGARLTSGSHPLYEVLEEAIAQFKHTEAAIVFNTGYMANLGVISSIMGKSDVIFSDELNHASIIDGCRLSGAKRVIFGHRDMGALKEQIALTPCSGRRLIVVDGVFSMDGDIAPLRELVAIKEQYGAMLMVDDAHATGVLGGGRGTAAHFGLEGKVDIQMGTLSKSLGAEGAYVAGSSVLIDFLKNKARSYIFSTALAPSTIAAAHAALQELIQRPVIVDLLHHNARFMRSKLKEYGIETNADITPIIPIMVGRAETAVKLATQLKEDGLIVSAIRPPTVPIGQSRLRLVVSAAHEEKDLAQAAVKIAARVQEIRDEEG